MALGADDVQAARRGHLFMAITPRGVNALEVCFVGILDRVNLCLRTAAEHDVGTASGHVGGNGDGAGSAGLGDDMRLALMLFGIEDFVRNFRTLQQLGNPFGRLDRGCAHQHRLPALHAILDVLENGLEFILLGQKHEIRLILADHRLVGRDHHHFQPVNLLEFESLRVRGAGHAG